MKRSAGNGGGAIYYDGIDTDLIDQSDPNRGTQAMWLTKEFVYPDWPTNSDFGLTNPVVCSEWDHAANPAGSPTDSVNDTGQSVIINDDVKITIDYELVDFYESDPDNYSTHSPISYLDPKTGLARYIYSDQYCILQTYTILNQSGQTLTNLEFYQFLHSHGDDEYGPCVNSTYCSEDFTDPLADYVPYNSVHCAAGSSTVGNFRYDITQWNTFPHPDSDRTNPARVVSHTDFVGFSCAVEPDWVDNDFYRGGHLVGATYKPAEGTHIHIENREMNGNTAVYTDEVGGAMGWSLGSLAPDETAKITVVFMYVRASEEPAAVTLEKSDDVEENECVSPTDDLTYTIEWTNDSSETLEDVTLVDILPEGVTYDHVISVFPPLFDPNYNEQYHTYTWDLGDIGPLASGTVELKVEVNDKAEPGLQLYNEVFLLTGDMQITRTDCNTPVCCWDPVDPNMIFVDWTADGNNTGTSWQDAYTDLQDALSRARDSVCPAMFEIRVAQGVYDPGVQPEDTFSIPDGVKVHGGYRGGPVSPGDRNIKKYVTILDGYHLPDEVRPLVRNEAVVTMGDETLLDGFTITGSADYGIYGNGVNFAIKNCKIIDNEDYGIRAINGNVTIEWCEISINKLQGIRHEGLDYILELKNSQVMRNMQSGIFCLESTPIVKNSIISESGLGGAGDAGIRMINPTYSPILYNNTFANNRSAGISFTDNWIVNNDANYLDYPDLQNCIVYYNNGGGKQLEGFDADNIANFCCIQDCNELGTTNYNDEPGFAYVIDPAGTPDPNNYHLAYDSFCMDKANPFLDYTGQVDIDGEGVDRKYGSYVDIGADEVYSCKEPLTEDDISNELDWTHDGMINLEEFNIFSRGWLTQDPNVFTVTDPNVAVRWFANGKKCDLSGDKQVNLDDLAMFCNDDNANTYEWLWIACWKKGQIIQQMAMSGGSGESVSMLQSLSLESTLSVPIASPTEETVIEVLDFVEDIIENDAPENKNALLDLVAYLEDELKIIRKENK